MFSQVWTLRTPKNISYLWGFGRFLGVIIVIQVMRGLFLAFYYVSGSLGWDSVVEISREVNGGWLFRLIHGNSASYVFLIIFIHFFRGIIQRSFQIKGPWIRGWGIIFLTIAAAFLGYVLPWGQMSFWGATVIINLIRVLPKGKLLVVWLWGGFYVSSFTCRFFYALHFLIPFIVLLAAGIHLIFLHFTGSSVPGGLSRSNLLKLKFSYLFSFKDIVNLSLIWAIWLWALAFPDWSADPVNFITSDLSNSPLHIQPEWYFLHLYAILRSIPNKLGGLIGFGLALVLLLRLRLVKNLHSLSQFSVYNYISWSFLASNILLMWLGIQPVEEPYVIIGQVEAVLYFSFFFIVLATDGALYQLTVSSFSVIALLISN